jgi:RNA polymerase sigma-70 factor (ECF subfamily)
MVAEARNVLPLERGPAPPTTLRPGEDEPDAVLVARFRAQQSRAAFETLVRRHQRGVYAFVRRFVKSHDDAADLTQRTFVRAMGSIGTFEGRSEFRTWLFRIAVNLCKNHHRDRGRRGEVAMDLERLDALEAPGEAGAGGGGGDGGGAALGPGGLITREETEAVRAAVETLPPKQQMTLCLRVYQDMSFKEVAQAMGCREGTAKVNFHHAVARLRRALAERRGGAAGRDEDERP